MECGAIEVLHNEVRNAIFLPEFMHRNDVLMLQIGRRLGFDAKAPHHVGLTGSVQKLDRDYPAHGRIESAVDLSEAAATDSSLNLILSDALLSRGWRQLDLDVLVLGQARLHIPEHTGIAMALALDKSIPIFRAHLYREFENVRDALAALSRHHCTLSIPDSNRFSLTPVTLHPRSSNPNVGCVQQIGCLPSGRAPTALYYREAGPLISSGNQPPRSEE